MNDSQREKMNISKMGAMLSDGLVLGARIEIRGLEKNLHTDDMTGGKFMSDLDNRQAKGPIIDLRGYVGKIESDSFTLVFGWNRSHSSALGLGGVQVYGNAVERYHISTENAFLSG